MALAAYIYLKQNATNCMIYFIIIIIMIINHACMHIALYSYIKIIIIINCVALRQFASATKISVEMKCSKETCLILAVDPAMRSCKC